MSNSGDSTPREHHIPEPEMLESADETISPADWSHRLLSLIRSTRQRDLALHLGRKQDKSSDDTELNLEDLTHIRTIEDDGGIKGLYHQAADQFLRNRVEPFQAVLATWMNGAKARVGNQDIPFNQVVTWCQNAHDANARRLLTKEVRSLCRFLVPFSHATWKALLKVVREELHYTDYITFCEEKRNISLRQAAREASGFLEETEVLYQKLLQPLLQNVTGLTRAEASRFDAIYLLGMRYLDRFFPARINVSAILCFFKKSGYGLVSGSNQLVIHEQNDPGAQPYCIPIDIPGEIHILTGPLHGWIDLESLCHELGHGLSFLYVDAKLPPERKDFFQSWGLAESFAFLFQKVCMSTEFLREVLSLDIETAQLVSGIHEVKWLTLSRRYAAKLMIEEMNFQQGYLQRGQHRYADSMQRQTGFSYDPETYLFDLMPDFYSLDYFQAFLGSASIEQYFRRLYGPTWFLEKGAGDQLRSWWSEGICHNLGGFIREKTGQPLTASPLIDGVTLRSETGANCSSF